MQSKSINLVVSSNENFDYQDEEYDNIEVPSYDIQNLFFGPNKSLKHHKNNTDFETKVNFYTLNYLIFYI